MTIGFSKNTQISLLLSFAFLLASCGFQLKQSAAIPLHLSPISIQGVESFSSLYKTIKNSLKQSEIQLADSGHNQLILSQIKDEKRILSVANTGKVAEYELLKSITFTLIDSTGQTIIAPKTLSSSSSYTVSSTDVLAKDLEADDLNRRMEEKLVDQMFRFIAHQLK